jgi:hypothetical protein
MILFVVRGWRANGSIDLMPIAQWCCNFERLLECRVAAGCDIVISNAVIQIVAPADQSEFASTVRSRFPDERGDEGGRAARWRPVLFV